MQTLTKWIRKIHRWLVIPFFVAISILIISSIRMGEDFVSPGWLGVLGIGSLFSLFVSGLYMFVQHYLSRWRRSRRNRNQPSAAPLPLSDEV